MTDRKTAEGLLAYIKESVTPFHAVRAAKKRLEAAGFGELPLRGEWKVVPGGRYYTEIYQKTLAAFTIGTEGCGGEENTARLRIAAAHTDYPCLHIKPKADMVSGPYLKLDTEVYGGPILNTWFDRPLSIAGCAALKSGSAFAPGLRLYDAGRPLLTLPNLAIHMNREVNKGVEIQKQKELLPLFGLGEDGEDKEDFFLKFLASELGTRPEEILDYDLYLYNTEEGCALGAKEEFLSSPRLDNLTSCYAVICALSQSRRERGVNLGILFDHEEIGSGSKQGADSAVLSMLLEKIYCCAGYGRECLREDIFSGFLLSADVAHALHPNRADKYDPMNQAPMNSGVTIKINSNQKYSFDTEAVACVAELCGRAGIPYRKFVNHSDLAGGGTLGPIISSWLPMRTVDIGVPILAMHSAREMMGIQDQGAITALMREFYSQY